MVLGFAKAIKDLGFNPQKIVFFECNDIDPLCVNMSYIQLSLNGLKAIVTRGIWNFSNESGKIWK